MYLITLYILLENKSELCHKPYIVYSYTCEECPEVNKYTGETSRNFYTRERSREKFNLIALKALEIKYQVTTSPINSLHYSLLYNLKTKEDHLFIFERYIY